MKVFVTGGTGYIGNRIVHHLVDKGYTVHALVRSKQKANLLQREGIELFVGDLTNKEAMIEAMLGCDFIIHSAAFAALHTTNTQLYYDINVKGSQQVYYAAQESGIKKMVFISSAGVLGPSQNNIIREDSPRTVAYFNEYEKTKAEAESWLLNKSAQNLEVLSLNLSRVFGPGQLTEANAGTRLLQQVAKGWRVIPGDGKSIGNYIFIDDVLEACHRAIEMGKGGERYIIGGDNIDFETYFEVAKKATGATQAMIHVPVSIIMTIARGMSLMARFGVTPTITPPWVRRYMYNWELDNKKAQTQLGMRFTPFEEGITKTVEWLKREELIKTKPLLSKL